jgi:hypothetical protein
MLQLRTCECVFVLSYCYLVLLTVAQVSSPSEGEFNAPPQLDFYLNRYIMIT